jgi:DNA (cytosine-5)-methyltransferase 1
MATAYTLKIRGGCEGGGKGALVQTDKSATLSTLQDQTLFQPVICLQGNGIDRADTAGCNGKGWREGVSYTLNTLDRPAVVYNGSNITNPINKTNPLMGDPCHTLTDDSRNYLVQPVISLDRASFNQGKNAQFDFEVSDKGINSPIVAKGPSAVCYSIDQGGGKSACNVAEGQAPTLTCTHGGEPAVCYEQPKFRYTVRRLTPLECERLQGFPDGWTDIGDWTDTKGKVRKTSDSARYKALGNSIALPPWKWVIKRLCACYERDATMASLFDGIGGFPYIWEQINGKGSCLWASEIEEFPIAVTKERIR